MSQAQDDVNAAVASLTTATADLNAATAQLTALGIPAPVDTSALNPAVAAMVTSVTNAQAAVTAEAAKLNPTPPAAQ